MFIKKKKKKTYFPNLKSACFCFSKSFNVGLDSCICFGIQSVAMWCFEVHEEIWPHVHMYLGKNILIASNNCGYSSDTYQNFRIGSFLKVSCSVKSETFSTLCYYSKIHLSVLQFERASTFA